MSGKVVSTFLKAPLKGLNWRFGPFAPEDYTIEQYNLISRTYGLTHVGLFRKRSGTTAVGENWWSLFRVDDRVFGVTTANIYSVYPTAFSVSRALSASLGYSVQGFTFATGADHFLFLYAYGITPQIYTYSTDSWANLSITGPTLSSLNLGCAYRKRIYFVENGGIELWYLNPNAVSGAAAKYDLGSLMVRGGYIKAITSFTRDGGDGSDDILLVLTNTGDLLAFSGNDPGSATWVVLGVFDVGPTRSDNPWFKLGGEVYVNTYNGILPISKILSGAALGTLTSLSENVDSGISAFYGFKVCNLKGVLVGLRYGYMMELETGAWNTVGELWGEGTDTAIYDILDGPSATVYLTFNDSDIWTWTSTTSNPVAPFKLRTPYLRFGQVLDWQSVQIRPWFQVTSDKQEITLGVCCDLSDDYKTVTISNTTQHWRTAGHFSGNFSGFGVTPVMTWAWMTVGVSPGPAVSFSFECAPPTPVGAGTFLNFKFWGWDVRLQAEASPT